MIAVGASFAFPKLGFSSYGHIERVLQRLARRKRLAVFTVGISALLGRLALLPRFPIPLPVLPDDFSFLLSGDTFALGRLTNPTPPMWMHFESIHISMQPTYMSMYFPGEGMFLALGQVLFGHPWYGLMLANTLMCAAICWMLQAWLPPGWALLGGMIAVVRLSLFSYWINSYTGAGAIAALGGALVLGALPRFKRTPHFRYALLMAIGGLLIAYTRPYEGLLLSLPVAAALVRWFLRSKKRPPASAIFRQCVIPVLLLVAGAVWLGYYDFRVNGSPFILPYKINRATYATTPYYVWQKLRPEPAYRHEEMRRFYRFDELSQYDSARQNFIKETLLKAAGTFQFYAGLMLIPPLFMLHRIVLDRRIRFLLFAVLVLAAGMTIEIYLAPHYVAPFTAAFYAIGLQGFRHLRLLTLSGLNAGMTILRLLVTLCFVLAGVRAFNRQLGLPIEERPPIGWVSWWFGPDRYGTERAAVQHELESLSGAQLAIVRYAQDHYPMDEWVSNSADIENAKVIWAQGMDLANDRKLLQYYKQRKAWLVQPDLSPDLVLSPYPVIEQVTDNVQQAIPDGKFKHN